MSSQPASHPGAAPAAPAGGPRASYPPQDAAGTNALTLAAYEARAEVYAAQTENAGSIAHRTFLRRLARVAPPGLVLEVGSAQGRDAAYLERHGRRVRRTDATAAFVDMLRRQGLDADRLDVLTDDLGAEAHGPYSAVLANAVLLHFTPEQLTHVVQKVHAALAPGGVLAFTVKVGDGQEWSEHKLGLPRFYQYWREAPLVALLEDAGYARVDVEVDMGRDQGYDWDWLYVLAWRD